MLQRRQNEKLFCNHLTSNFHLETRLTFQLHPTEPVKRLAILTGEKYQVKSVLIPPNGL
jgi:hypothetical protein